MQVLLSSRAVKQLSKLPPKMHDVIIGRIRKLADDPYEIHSKKLKDWNAYRIRVGDYRVIYTIEKNKIKILSVSHRKDAYKLK